MKQCKTVRFARWMGVSMILLAFCSLTACTKDLAYSERASSENGTVLPTTTTVTTAMTTSTSATTVSSAVTSSPQAGSLPQTNPFPTDDDTKLLWSERGLAVVPIADTEGYGKPLAVGEDYLGWTLHAFDGMTNAAKDAVTTLYADFTAAKPLAANGILTVLAENDAKQPNGLYLRVDNLAEFPSLSGDTRTRGWFMVANPEAVYEWLALEQPPVAKEYTLAVTLTVTDLHLYYTEAGVGNYDTITVSQAVRR